MSRLDAGVHPVFTEDVLEALHNKQIFTVADFVKADVHQVVKTARLVFREVLAVKKQLLKDFSAAAVNGYDCYKTTLSNTAIIPTGMGSLDHLLGGGLFTGNIYELCGLPASGKTHFALNVTKNVALNLKQKVYYLDTKNDFCGQRMKKMLAGCGEETIAESLSRIVVSRVHTIHDLINCLDQIKNSLIEDNLKLRLLIVDSLPCLLLGSADQMKNNSCINHLANIIRFIAVEQHVAVLVTNLITTWNDGDFKNRQDTTENITCGKYWHTIPNTRLKIEKPDNQNLCSVTVLNSDTLCNKINSSCDIVLSDVSIL